MNTIRKTLWSMIMLICMIQIDAQSFEIKRGDFVPLSGLEDIKLYHRDGNFYVERDGELTVIKRYFVDKDLRGLDFTDLQKTLGNIRELDVDGKKVMMHRVSKEKYLKTIECADTLCLPDLDGKKVCEEGMGAGAYISVNVLSDGEYILRLRHRGLGGGYFGGMTGYWIGKIGTHLIAQTAIVAISGAVGLVCPPMVYPTFLALEKATLPAIEIASNTVAFGGAVVGMVATGPV